METTDARLEDGTDKLRQLRQDIGQRLQDLREAQCLSRGEIAKKAKVPIETLCDLENPRQRGPWESREELERVVGALLIELDWHLNGASTAPWHAVHVSGELLILIAELLDAEADEDLLRADAHSTDDAYGGCDDYLAAEAS